MAKQATASRRDQVDVHDGIGTRLRAERERRGVSLRALAKEVGISPSAMSQIETGRSRPSVSTLYAIVKELGMSLDALFSGGDAEPAPGAASTEPAVVRAATTAAAAGTGPVQRADTRTGINLDSGVRWERLTAAHDPDVDFLYVIYEAGGASSQDRLFMRHAGREYGLVLSGQLTVSTQFETHELGPGDSISFNSTIPHLLENRGTEPVTAVWVVVGREHDQRAAELAAS